VPWPYSRLFLILALVFFVLDALLLGGVIAGSGLQWLLPAGLGAWVLAMLVP
jgi:hypothetical protein